MLLILQISNQIFYCQVFPCSKPDFLTTCQNQETVSKKDAQFCLQTKATILGKPHIDRFFRKDKIQANHKKKNAKYKNEV